MGPVRLYPTNDTFTLDRVATSYEDGTPVETPDGTQDLPVWWDEKMLSPRDMMDAEVRRQALMLTQERLAEGDTGSVRGEPWEVLSVRDVASLQGVGHYEVRLQRVVEAR